MKTEAARFVEEMLARIRREFYRLCSEKHFYQERTTLIEAITWPATWMNRRGIQLPAAKYREIVGLVIATIKRHGNQVKFRRFSLYFFKAVQEHMNHHGEEYYYAAKVRPIGDLLPSATRDAGRYKAADPTTEIMSQMNSVLRSRGGRRRRDSGGSESDLFSSCKPAAAAVQSQRKHSQTFATASRNAGSFSDPGPQPAGDSGDS